MRLRAVLSLRQLISVVIVCMQTFPEVALAQARAFVALPKVSFTEDVAGLKSVGTKGD